MNSARELKIATSDRVVGLDMSAGTFPAEPAPGAEPSQLDLPGRFGTPDELRGRRPAGGRYKSEGCNSLHLAKCGRNVKSWHAFKDPASKARHQLVTAWYG